MRVHSDVFQGLGECWDEDQNPGGWSDPGEPLSGYEVTAPIMENPGIYGIFYAVLVIWGYFLRIRASP